MTLMTMCAHPDDAEISVGGTIANHAAEGHKVVLVLLTKGDMGHEGRVDPQLAERRCWEARSAAQVLGCEVVFLPFKDTDVEYSRRASLLLAETIRKYRPEILLSHYAMDANPDHRTAAFLTSDARHYARLAGIKLKGEPHNVVSRYTFPPVLREMHGSNSFRPDIFIDITKVFLKKMEALKMHRSQMEENPHYLDLVEARARSFGAQAGVKYAEAFMADVKPAFDLLPTVR